MECVYCLEENNHMIRAKGHGRSCIPQKGECVRHLQMTTKSDSHGEWAWSDGQPYERSSRRTRDAASQKESTHEYSKALEQSAYSTSLHHDENTWDILNQSLSGSGFKVSNKREELGDKLASRDMVQQIGFNPFLGSTNYVDDISIRDQYLKPVNTTQGEMRQKLSQ